jgi:hypothetical protein
MPVNEPHGLNTKAEWHIVDMLHGLAQFTQDDKYEAAEPLLHTLNNHVLSFLSSLIQEILLFAYEVKP